jgi:hypothetical protein
LSKYRDLLISSENLSWAWRKAQRLYQFADGPYDVAELARFELDLERQLQSIARDFRTGAYKLAPLVLLPQPKKPDENGRSRLRQSFHVSVRDQVAWIALVNVIGPTLDSKMPPWSYGHRLYKAAWYEEQNGRSHLELGPYRHSGGSLYRRFKHSWPLFRRHISLTARLMVHGLGNPDQLDPSEKSALNYAERPPYLNTEYWPATKGTTLYYGSIDLEKFYPRVTAAAILRAMTKYLDQFRGDAWLQRLLERMLAFRVTPERSVLLNDQIAEPLTEKGPFGGIPTGLMVAGFLSNVALLPLDRFVERRLKRNNRVAHFRFVDDHAILSYDFDQLCIWIRTYKLALKRMRIGPEVSQGKYDPPDLFRVVEQEVSSEDAGAIKAQSEIDGANPTKLMTKTLALVSELAGSDFDILAEQSRELKLSELEWLLLADIPDREIRADTRAAFAAGRIAKLVPIVFAPSIDVLQPSRELARLEAIRGVDETIVRAARQKVLHYRKRERVKYRNRLDHYFKLTFQAFRNHIDKPRLMLRVLDYCRITGQAGTILVLKFLLESLEDKKPLAEYLKALAVQVIARHIVTATFDMSDKNLLERQRHAARYYLDTLTRLRVRTVLCRMVNAERGDLASVSARQTLLVAVSCAAAIIANISIRRKMVALANELEAPNLISSSQLWTDKTGSPIGVWAHWLDGLISSRRPGPGRIWRLTATHHDPENKADWENLRKGPKLLPRRASMFLGRHATRLQKSDTGWLLDQQSSTRPLLPDGVVGKAPAVRQLQRHLLELERNPQRISLLQWVSHLKTLSPYDPRVSEWSALEIVRQLALTVQQFGQGKLDDLNNLHPSNIIVPRKWLEPNPSGVLPHLRWTWESWKQVAKSGAIRITKNKIEDYRRHPIEGEANDPEYLWRARLRGVGLLLFGLCRRDFGLPSLWNVRGLERDVAGYIRYQLEETAISSRTQAIIESAVLPRSAETALMVRNLWAFFGNRLVTTINDTATDPPDIVDVQALVKNLEVAQEILGRNQISVLNHAARQLIPMNAVQLTKVAAEPIQLDEEL